MWQNYYKESTIRIIYTSLLLAGGLLIAWSLWIIRTTKPELPFYRSASGIVRSSEQQSPLQHRIKIEFELPNSTFITSTGILTSETIPSIGDDLLVHYNPYDPSAIELDRLPPVPYPIILFFGIMTAGLGFRFFIRTVFRNAKIAFIREHGKKVEPTEIRIEEHLFTYLWIIHIPSLLIHCRWEHAGISDSIEFISEPFPLKYRDKFNLPSVRVYFIQQDPRRYFIDPGPGFDS